MNSAERTELVEMMRQGVTDTIGYTAAHPESAGHNARAVHAISRLLDALEEAELELDEVKDERVRLLDRIAVLEVKLDDGRTLFLPPGTYSGHDTMTVVPKVAYDREKARADKAEQIARDAILKSPVSQWGRERGLTYNAVLEAVNMLNEGEVSTGAVVERLRALAWEATEKERGLSKAEIERAKELHGELCQEHEKIASLSAKLQAEAMRADRAEGELAELRAQHRWISVIERLPPLPEDTTHAKRYIVLRKPWNGRAATGNDWARFEPGGTWTGSDGSRCDPLYWRKFHAVPWETKRAKDIPQTVPPSDAQVGAAMKEGA